MAVSETRVVRTRLGDDVSHDALAAVLRRRDWLGEDPHRVRARRVRGLFRLLVLLRVQRATAAAGARLHRGDTTLERHPGSVVARVDPDALGVDAASCAS